MKYKLHRHRSLHFSSLLNFHPCTVCAWLSCTVHCKLATYHNRDQIIETGQNTQPVQKQHVGILTSAATWSIYQPAHLYIYCGSLLIIPLCTIVCFWGFVCSWMYRQTVQHYLHYLAFQFYWLSLHISASGKMLPYLWHKECIWGYFQLLTTKRRRQKEITLTRHRTATCIVPIGIHTYSGGYCTYLNHVICHNPVRRQTLH